VQAEPAPNRSVVVVVRCEHSFLTYKPRAFAIDRFPILPLTAGKQHSVACSTGAGNALISISASETKGIPIPNRALIAALCKRLRPPIAVDAKGQHGTNRGRH
jgi:hypothetical protein